MPRLTAFSRIIQHGVSDPLSGATIPSTNIHTDGTWSITDLYDREILINTGSGHMDYRADQNIWSPVISSGATKVKQIMYDIGGWDVSTAFPTINASELNGKKILSMKGLIYPDPADPNPTVYPHDYKNTTFPSGYEILLNNNPSTTIDLTKLGIATDNFFTDTNLNLGYYSDLGINRGVIIIKYMD